MRLALQAGVSTRHLSFVETGRSSASRDLLLRLASALDMPLRHRNELLESGGFARLYSEMDLSRLLDHEGGQAVPGPEGLESVRRALNFILRQQEPYSAIVIDRAWNILQANRPHHLLLDALLGSRAVERSIRDNVVRLVFSPGGLRPAIVNWDQVARTMLGRVRRELAADPDDRLASLLKETLAYPGVPAEWAEPNPEARSMVVLPIHLRGSGIELRLFNVITTLGTPQDVALEEIRIESFFPADEETDRTMRSAPGASA